MGFEKRAFLFMLPSAIQAALSFAVLPITTRVLGPADYGIFGLLSALSSFGVMVAPMGATLYLQANFASMDFGALRRFISTILILGSGILLVIGGALYAAWFTVLPHWAEFSGMPTMALHLILLSMVFSFPWVLANDLITLGKRAEVFTAVMITQTVVSSTTVITGLYVFGWGMLSLFAASLAGALVTFGGALIVLRPYLGAAFDAKSLRTLWLPGLTTVAGNLLETVQMNIERVLLSLHLGMSQLGLYTHAQRYKELVGMPVSIFGRAVLPTALAESRDLSSPFTMTRKAWNSAYLLITVAGVTFATMGKHVIGLLTHGKFTQAYPYAVCWMVFLLFQFSGRPQVGTLIAHGHMTFYSKSVVIATCCSMVALFVLIPAFGGMGAIAAYAIQQVILRTAIRYRTRLLRKIPFQDAWLLAGIFFILGTWGLSEYLDLDLFGNAHLLLAVLAVIAFSARGIFTDIFARFRGALAT